ncbi:MAG TPA: hypothetical protein VNK47_11315 [Candidatus Dormibacteraeota bacterium]|nr:hypothetical protein [Candidatus Dormibacteraeota bacterium]
MSTPSREVRGAATKPLLRIWSAQHSLTRHELAITDHSEERLALVVERFGRSWPDRLEFMRVLFERSDRELDRDEFTRWIRALCAEKTGVAACASCFGNKIT